jgi:hypothetical protein
MFLLVRERYLSVRNNDGIDPVDVGMYNAVPMPGKTAIVYAVRSG